MRPRPELSLGLFGPGVIDGSGSFNHLGGCTSDTEIAQPGDDCGPANGQVMSQDDVSTVWSITADNFEPGTADVGPVVFEQTIVPTAGAVVDFARVPVACVPPPNGTGGTGAPVSEIRYDYPNPGEITLICNLGQFAEGSQESMTTVISVSGESVNGSTFTTRQRVYRPGDLAVPALADEIGPIAISARPAWDLKKLAFRNMDATTVCVDSDGNPGTPCENVRGYFTYTILRFEVRQRGIAAAVHR
jgi:hypothetical protein